MYNLVKEKGSYFCLGKFIKTHGYKGEILLLLDTDNLEEYDKLKLIFVDMEGSLVPWFIDKISIKEDIATIHLEEIDGPDEARKFLKKDVYLVEAYNVLKDITDYQARHAATKED